VVLSTPARSTGGQIDRLQKVAWRTDDDSDEEEEEEEVLSNAVRHFLPLPLQLQQQQYQLCVQFKMRVR